jgi:phenylacetaldehyde dehydrogenase
MDVATSHARLGPAARDFIARRHKLLIDGHWVDAKSGKSFAVFDPSNGQQIAQVAEGGPEDIADAVIAARRAFEDSAWSRMKPTERGKLVWKLGDVLEAHAGELAELESLDNGKPISDARAVDIPFGCELLRYMGGWSTKITGQSIPISAPGDWHAYSIREPVGVVGQIIPWNFPLLMAVWKIAPALAAGCTIVLKPAEQTPLTAIRLGELIMEAGFPAGVANIVTGDGTAGAALAAHPDVDKVAFTGSTEVGKLIVQASAGNLKRVSLELGGKSPDVVFADADLDAAVPGAGMAVFANSGQICSAGTRLFVEKKIYEEFTARVAEFSKTLRVGNSSSPDTQVGPLVSPEQLDRVTGYLAIG